MLNGQEVTVTVDGVDYSATVGLVNLSGDSRRTSVSMDDRGIYWTSRPVDLENFDDEKYNKIAELLCAEYRI